MFGGRRRAGLALSVTVAALLAAGGCAKGGAAGSGARSPGPAGSTPPAASSPAGSGGGDYGDYAGGGKYGSSSAPAASVDTIRQGVGGFSFSPATMSVNKGDRLTIQNIGSTTHTFTIRDHGIDVVNQPGQSKQVTIDLVPGTYQFVCTIHESLGMRGVLTVTG